MILLILYVQTTYQTLLYQFNANSLVRDGWEDIYNNCNFNACGGFYYFGSPNNNKKISRIFLELEHHSRIIMDLQYLSVDSDVDPYVEIDSIIFNKVVTKTSSLICQNGQAEFIHNITITLPHNRRTFYVLMEFQFGGLISLKLNIIKCQDGCAGCIENYPQNCRQWKLHQYSFNNKMITYSDGWTFTLNYEIDDFCGNCQFLTFWEINYFTRLPPHQDVLIRFFKRHNTVVTVDYLYGKQTVSSGYQVEVLVKNHNDLILIVNIKSVSQNNFVRDFEVFYTQPDWLLPNAKINEGCLDQIDNKCLICKDGWNLDEIFGNCHAICGDGIIQLQEECDDGNQISNDSCHQCKYKCVEFCEICEFGTCLQLKDDPFYEGCQDQIDGRCLICQEGWISNEFIGNCHAICGDGIIQLHEECDDGNEISNDSCHQCKYKCVEFCEICEFGICLGCQGGFVINDKNNCDPQCGDGILIPYSLEQCELAVNGVFNDCLDCLITPIPKCKTNCFSVCLVCEDGYEFFNNSCLSVCGDEIVTKEEDCDDGNFEPYDGCFLCQYSCPENCYDCYQGTCLECNYQYQLLTSNECKQSPRCGDELLEGQEQCEDGNNLASDGCQNCLIEKDWICILNKRDIFSQCTFVKSPNFFINYLNMTYNKQYIIMQFNQKVKVETFQPLSETIYFELTNTEKKFWNGSLFIIQDVGSEGNQGEFIIIIEIYQLVESRPVLKVQVNQEVTIDRQNLCKNLIKFDENIYNAVLEDLEKQITLQYPQFIDEQQEGYSQGLKGLNQIIIYCLTGTVVINLLQGNTDLFIEIFAILQFQQYLRYGPECKCFDNQNYEDYKFFILVYSTLNIQKIQKYIFLLMILQQFNLSWIFSNFLNFSNKLVFNKIRNILKENLICTNKTLTQSSIFHANYFNCYQSYSLRQLHHGLKK